MSDTVAKVEEEWENHTSLQSVLGNWVQAIECLLNNSGVNVVAKERSKRIGTGQPVEASSEVETCDSVEGGQHPCQLWLVDGQMWRHWSVLSLLNQDFLLSISSGSHRVERSNGLVANKALSWSSNTTESKT